MTYRQRVKIRLHISADEFLAFYKGTAKSVSTRASDGRRIQFPAEILRPFITESGIHGEFVITFDENNKLVDVQRLT